MARWKKDGKAEKVIFANVEICSLVKAECQSEQDLVMQLENKAEDQTVGKKNLNLLRRHAMGTQ